jgi:hypothetical protein
MVLKANDVAVIHTEYSQFSHLYAYQETGVCYTTTSAFPERSYKTPYHSTSFDIKRSTWGKQISHKSTDYLGDRSKQGPRTLAS